jgi:hypothetical protein
MMRISRGISFIVIGGLLTMISDAYFSSSSWILLLFAALRTIGIFVALIYRIIYDHCKSTAQKNTALTFWNPFKNLFVVIAAVQQAFVLYHLKSSADLWSILFIVQQMSMPLLAYLWVRRIQREDFRLFQQIWLEIVGLNSDASKSVRETSCCFIGAEGTSSFLPA